MERQICENSRIMKNDLPEISRIEMGEIRGKF